MRNERVRAAMALKKQITATELAANTTLAEVGVLLTTMGRASLDTGMLAQGQAAIDKALEMASAAGALRSLAGDTHRLLAQVKVDAGLSAVALGDDDECPDSFSSTARLRAV